MGSRGKRYTEEQIIAILKEAAGPGAKVGEVLRRHGVTPHTYYRWKTKFAGMEVSDARRLRQLEEENRRLKRVVAQQALDIHVLKEILGQNGPQRLQRGVPLPACNGSRSRIPPALTSGNRLGSPLSSEDGSNRSRRRGAARMRLEGARTLHRLSPRTEPSALIGGGCSTLGWSDSMSARRRPDSQ
jgi:putative transposase